MVADLNTLADVMKYVSSGKVLSEDFKKYYGNMYDPVDNHWMLVCVGEVISVYDEKKKCNVKVIVTAIDKKSHEFFGRYIPSYIK